MDAHGIDIQLVSGVEAVTYDALSGNPALAAAITGHERLRGMFVIDPRFLQEAEAQLEELLPSGLFLGAKIHTDYAATPAGSPRTRSEEHTSELQSRGHLVCRRLLANNSATRPARPST